MSTTAHVNENFKLELGAMALAIVVIKTAGAPWWQAFILLGLMAAYALLEVHGRRRNRRAARTPGRHRSAAPRRSA